MQSRAPAAALAFIVTALSACGAFLPSLGDDDEPGGAQPSDPSAAQDGGLVSTADGQVVIPPDPSIAPVETDMDASFPDAAGYEGGSLTDAGYSSDSGIGYGGGTTKTWHCTTKQKAYPNLSKCEEARTTTCQPPRSDVVDSATCAIGGEVVTTCTACNTTNSFFARSCYCF